MTTDYSAPAVTVRGPVGGGITLAADPVAGNALIECWGGAAGSPRLLVCGVVAAPELAALAEHVVGAPGQERSFELAGRPTGANNLQHPGGAISLRHTGGAVVRVTASSDGQVRGVITIDRDRLALQARMFADALSAMSGVPLS